MAASKVPGGLKSAAAAAMDDAAAVKMAKGTRWAPAMQFFFLALSVVAMCALLYAPRFLSPAPAPYGAIAGFFTPKLTSTSTTSSSPVHLGPEHVAAATGDGADRENGDGAARHVLRLDNHVGSPCASLPDHGICCDRTDYHSDVCFMSGDVRTDAASLSLLLFPPPGAAAAAAVSSEERIRPYTRKWDSYITKTIHEVTLRSARPDESTAGHHRCDVRHDAPAFVMTAGGYSHNMFHVFNDGFLPLWLTAQHLRRRVVLAVLAYNPRWAAAYREIISALSGYRAVDLLRDKRTHCFPGAIVGTRYHDYLSVNATRLQDNKTIVDFHRFLAGAYHDGEPKDDASSPETETPPPPRPRLGIVSRKGRRVIENQAAVAELATSVGFDVEIMETGTGAPLAVTYAAVSSYDALVGVHGADLTGFLFLRPGRAALTQIAPLGITLLSRNLFGVPAARMGLEYEQYDVAAGESSLSRRYPAGHVVVADPARARREQGGKEWDLVEYVYLRGQNVSIDLGRFRVTLDRMYSRWKERQQQRQVSGADALLPQV
ncbi:unnamed protein product [Urochloa humidicola]